MQLVRGETDGILKSRTRLRQRGVSQMDHGESST